MRPEKDLKHLGDILGQTGADSNGIVLNAASAANKWLRARNLTWPDVLNGSKASSTIVMQLAEARAAIERLRQELAQKAAKPVTKTSRGKRACAWCRKPFTPDRAGRPPKFCSPSCRQGAFQQRKGDWRRQAEKEAEQRHKTDQLRSELVPRLRHVLLAELVQSGVIKITSPDHIDLFVAQRNEWRGSKVLHELEVHFRGQGDEIGLAAIAKWRQARKTWSAK